MIPPGASNLVFFSRLASGSRIEVVRMLPGGKGSRTGSHARSEDHHDRRRVREIAGTRITVYDVLDYHKLGWHRDVIAVTLSINSRQVEAAIRYIEEHRDEVMADYEEMLARDTRGNPPGLQTKLDAAHERLQARLRDIREAKDRKGQGARHSGGH